MGDFQDKVVMAQELKLWSGLELDEAAAWAIRNGWSCILEACCPGPQGGALQAWASSSGATWGFVMLRRAAGSPAPWSLAGCLGP